jgi:hypothetical protein
VDGTADALATGNPAFDVMTQLSEVPGAGDVVPYVEVAVVNASLANTASGTGAQRLSCC